MSVLDESTEEIVWDSSVREAVRAKYAYERDKRLRPDGPDQYITVDQGGEFSEYLEDQHADALLERASIVDDVQVTVIGGGFAGLLSAARLRQGGATDVRIIERGSDFGGTWYWNRYPGAQCDTESYIYMPLLEEVGYVPTEKYARAPEIFEHSKAIARKFDLYRDALLQTEVTSLEWDADANRWIVGTNRGDVLRSRFVVWGCGAISRPKLPGIPGIHSFEGKSFHSSRWDYNYTGGDNQGNLTGLADKKVAIVGTGATAVQIVPYLGAWAEHLYVFEDSVEYRPARQPAHRSGMGIVLAAGLADPSDAELHEYPVGYSGAGGSCRRRLDHDEQVARADGPGQGIARPRRVRRPLRIGRLPQNGGDPPTCGFRRG